MLDDTLVIVLAGGAGERLYPADEGPRQAGRLLRRPVPHHRLHAQQLHQLRAAPHLHRHAVQVAVAQPPHPHGLERRLGGARRVHRDPAAAEARRRALVPGHGRRGLPEPLLDHAREPAARRSCSRATTSTRWTTRRCCASTRSAAPRRRWPPSRCRSPRRTASASSRSTSTERVTGFQEKPSEPTPMPGLARPRAGVDGHLHLRHRRAGARRSKPTRAARHEPRLRQGHHPGADPRGAGLRLPLLRREQEGVEVLARHRHARRLLRSQHGPVPGQPGVQPVRSRSGRCAPTSRRRRRRSSCSPRRARAAARRSTRSSRPAASSRAAASRGSVLCPNVRVHSFCDIEQ